MQEKNFTWGSLLMTINKFKADFFKGSLAFKRMVLASFESLINTTKPLLFLLLLFSSLGLTDAKKRSERS
jgi:hypothetical protein